MMRRWRWSLTIALLAAVVADTLLQIAWKAAVLQAPSGGLAATWGSLFSDPLFASVIALMTFQFFNWLVVLGKADLSYAKPAASLSYACVPVFSAPLLNEPLDILEITGVVFVAAGVWFICRTEPTTKDQPKLP